VPHLCPRWRLLNGSQLRMCIPQPRANWEATAARRQFPVLSYRHRQVAGQRGQRVPQLCEASVCLIFFSISAQEAEFWGSSHTNFPGVRAEGCTEIIEGRLQRPPRRPSRACKTPLFIPSAGGGARRIRYILNFPENSLPQSLGLWLGDIEN
jgi:hypothetical protein